MLRRSVDLSTLPPSFHNYKVHDKDTTVFVIHGDLQYVGQDAIIRSCQEWFDSKKKNPKPRHDPSTSIRLVAAMLHESVRDPVRRVLENRKDRSEMDQSNNTDDAVFELVLAIFKDKEFSVIRPPEIDEWDSDKKIDPTGVDVSDKRFTAKWAKELWKDGIKPKYKVVQGRWSKETGGGDRTLASYINYTPQKGGNYFWLQWVYFLDGKCDFLLSSATGAERSDDFVSAESGFEDEDRNVSCTEYDSDTFKTPTPKRKRAKTLDVLNNNMKRTQDRMDSIMSVAQDFLQSREKTSSESDPVMKCLRELKELREHQSGIESDLDLRPELKEKALAGITKKKEVLVEKIDRLSNK